jgi:hypothetical protein
VWCGPQCARSPRPLRAGLSSVSRSVGRSVPRHRMLHAPCWGWMGRERGGGRDGQKSWQLLALLPCSQDVPVSPVTCNTGRALVLSCAVVVLLFSLFFSSDICLWQEIDITASPSRTFLDFARLSQPPLPCCLAVPAGLAGRLLFTTSLFISISI